MYAVVVRRALPEEGCELLFEGSDLAVEESREGLA